MYLQMVKETEETEPNVRSSNDMSGGDRLLTDATR
jgi:hypothetical protein